MARPRKTGLNYFSHDVDLSSDDKIEAMEGRYGPTGYAFYCKTLERIYRHGTPISYPGVFRPIMSGKLRITPGELDAMIDFAVEIQLLTRSDDGALMSDGAIKRLKFIAEGREFDRNRVIQRKTTGKLPENPIKESKVKEIKEEEIKSKRESLPRFQQPSIHDVSAYCLHRKNDVDPEKFIAHYESNGWRVGRNPMKSWKAAITTWEKGNKNGNQQFKSAAEKANDNAVRQAAELKASFESSTSGANQTLFLGSQRPSGT